MLALVRSIIGGVCVTGQDLVIGVRARHLIDMKGVETNASAVTRRLAIENKNLSHISIGFDRKSVSQLPLKDKAFLTFLCPSSAFELPTRFASKF